MVFGDVIEQEAADFIGIRAGVGEDIAACLIGTVFLVQDENKVGITSGIPFVVRFQADAVKCRSPGGGSRTA